MMQQILLEENKPYPNNGLPVLVYPEGFKDLVNQNHPAQAVIDQLAEHQYTNAWVNGIFDYHHFHSNTHEVLVCLSGEATVQLGGLSSKTITFTQGDVILLPAGTAHKRLKASKDFSIVGAYPNGKEFDTYKEKDVQSEEQFWKIKREVKKVDLPQRDPVQGKNGAVQKYWG
ncbi:cupin domain-containing protein [Marinilactibacillus sp. XAAS-LB27]|uniref:cupin domain-containing protein n=1 Tax=Marinilactibacillus sp. XAAS-LB27 TaxID=3114538 RepID=UPI002E187787|nr:cupin domain-containing protein [Marinilactibacillus sp. XAAS-LB27]